MSFPRSPLHPINSNSPHFLLWRSGSSLAWALPLPGLVLGEGRAERAQHPPGQPDGAWGCRGAGLQSPRACELPDICSRSHVVGAIGLPVSSSETLESRPSAHDPTAPPCLTAPPPPREGPAVSVWAILGAPKEWCWPAIPQMPAQLLRDLLAFWQMDTKWGTRPLAAPCSPAFLRLPPLLRCWCR